MVKNVVCRALFFNQLKLSEFRAVRNALKRGDFLAFLDKEPKQLLIARDIECEITVPNRLIFRINLKTKNDYSYDFLSDVCRAIVRAIRTLRKEADYGDGTMFFEYDTVDYFVEGNLPNKDHVKEYQEGFERKEYLEYTCLSTIIKDLIDNDAIGFSFDIIDEKFRIKAWIKDYDIVAKCYNEEDKRKLLRYIHTDLWAVLSKFMRHISHYPLWIVNAILSELRANEGRVDTTGEKKREVLV